MIEFEDFCYLDTPKTGSTYIRRFLSEHIEAKPLKSTKHRRVGYFYDKGKFYFSSCRDPIAQYGSLYRYGCNGKGSFHAFQEERGTDLLDTYTGDDAGFERWLDLILSRPFGNYMSKKAARALMPGLGLMSNRFYLLNMRGFSRKLLRPRSNDGLRRAMASRYIPQSVVKTESLNEDLLALVEGPLLPHIRDPELASKRLKNWRKPTNASNGDAGRAKISHELMQRVQEREWPHYEFLGYMPQA